MKKIIDLTNTIINGIKVLEFIRRDRVKKKTIWKCECHCGNIFETNSDRLRNDLIKSCGCKSGGRGVTKNYKYNEWEFYDDLAIGTTSDCKHFVIDLDAYDMVKDHCWRIDHFGYVVANNKVDNGIIKIHKILTTWDIVDHSNQDKLDNRLYNLRKCSKSQNNVNTKKRKDNKSGYTGVKKSKDGKWKSQISLNNKRIHIGTFDSFEDAVIARVVKERSIHGEFNGEINRNSLTDLINSGRLSDIFYERLAIALEENIK